MRPPISADEGGLSGMASAMGRGIGRVAIPVSLLIVALGLGYWLWTQPENAPSAPPTEAQAGLPATASDTPTPAPQQQTMAPPPAPAASPPLPQHAEIQPPPAAPATPAVTAPDVAAKPADVLFIPARRGDTLRSLYRAAYRAPRDRPSFEQLLAANPGLASDKPLDAGELVALPGPGGR
jgi:phage tail protein X